MSPEQEANQRASSGIKWNLMEQAGVAGIAFVATLVLSRILRPEDFGLVGMTTVLSNLLVLLVTLGFNYSVIQRATLEREDHESMFWFSFGSGILVAALFFLSAPMIATLYDQPELISVARALSLVFIFQGASSVPLGLLIKRMDFKSLAIAQVGATALSYALAIGFALKGFTYWAIVVQVLSFNATLVLMNLVTSGWWPQWTFRLSGLVSVRKFSAQFTLNQLLEFAASNLDAFLAGKYLGSRNLGLMTRAQALSMTPVTSFGFILNRTFFPWFSALQNQKEELRRRYTQSSSALLLVMFPMLALLGITGHDVVLVLFGDQWLAVAPLLKIYCWYASLNCINLYHDSFLTSQGRTDRLIRINTAEKIILAASVVSGLWLYGLVGLVLAKAATSTLFFFPRLASACSLVELSMGTWLRDQRRTIAALVLAMVTSYFIAGLEISPNPIFRLVAAIGLPALLYYGCLRLLGEPALQTIEKVLKEQLGLRKK